MAGPRLTPGSFAHALATTAFPNPDASGPPAYQATVGFGSGEHTMVDDYAAFWFDLADNRGAANYQTQGDGMNVYQDFCYADVGRRWSATSWQRTDHFLSPACR